MHRTLMAGMSLLALLAVAGCADSTERTSTGTSGSSAGTATQTDTSRYGLSGPARAGGSPGAGSSMGAGVRMPSTNPGPLSGELGDPPRSSPGGN